MQLETSLIDLLKEEQAKLGYMPGQVRLYYPLSSLNHFFWENDSAEEMMDRLRNLPASLKDKLGEVKVSHKGDRFCFYIPAQGSEYVHEHMRANEFIKDLVDLLAVHETTMEEIFALFENRGSQIIKEPMKGEEFDWLVRFADPGEDPYYYCFKDEGCHIIYHRFLPEDYEDFGF